MTSIPIILFAYACPDHLRQTLTCLEANHVPLICAFSDGPRTPDKVPSVARVRDMLRTIDWCEVVLCEREANLGLGRSILTGVTEVLGKHEAAIVFEDDLICVPGAYDYLCAALEHYRDVSRVMSVTGWTHPLVTPGDIADQPYFDGRAECWVWGTWARAWQGMQRDAKTLLQKCQAEGIDVYRYGTDLIDMANVELRKNIWAVRFLYWHILNRGLCLRPPWSMVEHIGFDAEATNAKAESWIKNPPLKPAPPIPAQWPEPVEHLACPSLWQKACGGRPTAPTMSHRIKSILRKTAARLTGSNAFDTMTSREFAKLLVPPLFVRAGRRVACALQHHLESGVSAPSTQPEWEYIPEGWAYAQTHPEVKGWNVDDVLETYKRKWPQFVRMVQGTAPLGVAHESALTTNEDLTSHNAIMAFAYALALAARRKDKLSMLDWGGGIGHYYLLAQALLPDVEIVYHCKDVPMLCEYGAQRFPQQHFFPDERCFERVYDFVLTSASMHYTEDWQTLLQRLAQATSGYLYIANLPCVQKAPSFVFVQRPYQYGYNTEYLAWCLNRTEFLVAAERAGVELVREFVYGYKPPIRGAPEQNTYLGFLFRTGSGKET